MQARLRGAAALLALALTSSAAWGADSIAIGAFSRLQPGAALGDWRPLTFKKIERHTIYTVVKDDGVSVVKAQSQASASGLVRNQTIDLKQFPILQWRWKVANILRKADPTQKRGDDYPARIYITFAVDRSKLSAVERFKYAAARLFYGEYPPLAAISYIWESKTPIGTVLPNAYTERVKMIVVQSGAEKLNQWLDMRRDVYEDYKQAFGGEPPLVSGVAIMTDTDNTGESATAYYGDLLFLGPPIAH
jgi:Protein of unknown function (DUF3047)